MQTSIASRIRFALLGLAIGISFVGALLALTLLYSTEDIVFARQLIAEQVSLEGTAVDDRRSWNPRNRMMALYWTRGQLPLRLGAVTGVEDGIYEYFDAQDAYFVLKGVLADTGSEFFLTYDVGSLLAVRSTRPVLLIIFALGTVVFILGAMGVALFLSRATLAPLRELTIVLQSGTDSDLRPGFSAQFSDDEVGVLAHALDQALQQVAASSRREFEFNRGVSHELRSPIHVVRNSVELLELALKDRNNPRVARPLDRLIRAADQIGYITEAFLWLASDSTVQEYKSSAVVAAERLLDDHEQLLINHSMTASMDIDDVEYQVPLPVFLVVVGNLLRNAIQHSDGNEVRCCLRADRIIIDDNGPANEVDEKLQGFGVGLEIVERICQRLNWRLLLETRAAGGIRASIVITGDEQSTAIGSGS